MPDKTPRESDKEALDRLLTEMTALIPDVVHQACHKLGYHLGAADIDGVRQDLFLELRDNDYHVLRSFQHQSEPSTWLFKIAQRQISRRLAAGKRKVSLDDLQPDSLAIDASQEQEVLRKEEHTLFAHAASKLEPEDQKLLGMMLTEQKTEEIAQSLGKSESATNAKKSRMKAKLRKTLTSPRKKEWPK